MKSLNQLIEYLNNNTTSHEKWIQYARAALAVGKIDQYISLLKQSTSDAGPLFNKVDNYNAMDDSTLKSYIDKLDSALATQEKGVETLSDEARDKKDKVDSLLQEKMESCKVEVEYRRQYDVAASYPARAPT